MFDTLRFNSTLKSLNMAGNSLGDITAEHIGTCLFNNSTLESLDVGGTLIGDHGAAFIANSLEENTSLVRLFIDGKKIGDRGAKCLANSIHKNTSLKALSLHSSIDNLVQEDVKHELVINKTPTLRDSKRQGLRESKSKTIEF